MRPLTATAATSFVERSSDDFALRNFLVHRFRSGATIRDGDRLQYVAGGESLVVRLIDADDDPAVPGDHPMRNPFGRYRLERVHGNHPASPVSRGRG